MATKKIAPLSRPPAQRESTDAPLLRLRIDGGTPEERYDFSFDLSRSGAVRLRFLSAVSGREVPEKVTRLDVDEVEHLRRAVDVSRLRRTSLRQARARQKPIPPCSLIGILEVWDQTGPARITFMADPGQAEQAGHRIPADVKKAVDAIYARAARHLGFDGPAALRS